MSKLGDFVRVQGGYAFKSSELSDDKTGVPVIKIGNITGGSFVDLSNYQSVSFQLFEKTKSFATKDNDILIAMTGANVGKTSRVPVNSDAYLINQRVGRFLLKEDCPYTSDFIYYVVSSKQAYQYFSRVADGAAQPNISGKTIEDLEFPNIDSRCANKIGNILKSLDDKIQLNTQINQTLEQIAQTIFKSWFIDFDPVHAKANALASGQTLEQAIQAAMAVISGKNTQELHRLQTANPEQYQQLWEIADAFPSGVDESGVPWGWSIKYFKDITSLYIDNRGKTPPIEESGIPLLEVKHLPENSIFPNLKTEKYISDDTYDSWLRQKLEPLDVVISTVGTIGRISLIPFNKKVAIAQNILGFRFKQDITNQVFMFYQMKSHKFNFDVEARLVETVQKSIKRKDLETIPLIIPDLKLQTFFEKMVLPAILKQDNENETLENIRDQLLPKLLSGELNGLSEKTI